MKIKSMKLITYFGLIKLHLIIRMTSLTVMTLFGVAKTFEMTTVTYGIKNIIYHVQRCLAMLHVDSHPKYLVFIQNNVLGEMLRQLNMTNNQLSVVMYPKNRVL